jgi:hypothetical protein
VVDDSTRQISDGGTEIETMNAFLRWSGWVLFGVFSVILSGCSGCNRTAIKTTQSSPVPADSLQVARDLYRRASEAASFRDANEQVNNHLSSHSDALTKHRAGSRDPAKLKELLAKRGVDVAKLDDRALYLKFLETVVGLDPSEIEEVDNTAFRLLDAHYLEGCFLFREIARSMPLQGLGPLEQAEFCFSWVVRQVVLQENREELLPPQYVLKRGQGSSRERAVVLAALLQQLDLDTCVIAAPDANGTMKPWLVGVLIPAEDQNKVYLFDARLGQRVPGAKGVGTATLADLQADPKLLDAFKGTGDSPSYDVDAKLLAKAEIWLIAPLSSLSARMRFLEEDVLAGFERINLAVRLPDLIHKCEQLKAGPVRVWNSPPKGEAGTETPTRSLRLFLPPDEGGVDKSKPPRLQAFLQQRVPMPAILEGFAEEKLLLTERPTVFDQMQRFASQMWVNYIIEPRRELIRGRLDDCTKRLMRIQNFVKELDAEELDEGMMDRMKKWRDRVVAADPAKLNEILAEDQWLLQVVNRPDEELSNPKQVPKRILSYIILRALSKPLQVETDYLLALRWQEKAERLQVQYELIAGGNATDAERSKAREKVLQAWGPAVSYWQSNARAGMLSAEAWQAALQAANDMAKLGWHQFGAEQMEYHVELIRQAAAAQLLRARALEKTNAKEAVGVLQKLQADLTALEKQANWVQLRAELQSPARPDHRDAIRKTLGQMEADFGPGGSLAWFRHAAAVRQAQLQRGPGS